MPAKPHSPRQHVLLLWFAWLLALITQRAGPSEARAEDNQPADSSRAEEIDASLAQLQRRISNVSLRLTVISVDRADAPFDIPQDRRFERIEWRSGRDGRYFFHSVRTRNGEVDARQAESADRTDMLRAEYPAGDSELEYPNCVRWSKGMNRAPEWFPGPHRAMSFTPSGNPNEGLRKPADDRDREILGEIAVDGETCVRVGRPGHYEAVRSPRFGWQAISSASESKTLAGAPAMRHERTWEDFREIKPGLWISHRGRSNLHAGDDSHFSIWMLDAIEIDPELKDDDFRIPFVQGTPVYRPGDSNPLPGGKPPAADAPLPMPAVVVDDTDQWGWNLGLAAACLLALVGLLRWRRIL